MVHDFLAKQTSNAETWSDPSRLACTTLKDVKYPLQTGMNTLERRELCLGNWHAQLGDSGAWQRGRHVYEGRKGLAFYTFSMGP